MISFQLSSSPGTVTVTCKFTVDDEVIEVKYDGNVLPVAGTLNNVFNEKTTSFTPRSDGLGEIEVTGEDINLGGHCMSAGLVLFCEATDVNSPWHNFKTNLGNWRAADGSALCSDTEGWSGNRYLFIRNMFNRGAKKIWTRNKIVTLIGVPKGN